MKTTESITTSFLLLPKGKGHDAGTVLTILLKLDPFCQDSVCGVFQSLENLILSLPASESLHVVLESLKILSSMTFLHFKSPVSLLSAKRSCSLIYFLCQSMKVCFAIHHLFISYNAALLMSSL